MPELPEVETVARGLRAHLPGRRIVGVQLGKTDFIDDPVALEQALPGSRFAEVRRHGKLMALRLERAPDGAVHGASAAREPLYLLIHLGMTGQVLVCRRNEPVKPHTHVFLTLDDGREVRYTDPRRFGRMRVAGESGMPAVLSRLGLEPLEMSEAEFVERLRGRRAMIKALLLNQAVYRGLGNIYADESLWRARIHPQRHAAQLSAGEQKELYRGIRKILGAAIRLGGSSISDYVNSDGEPGTFQIRHQAYDREGKPCRRCGQKIRRIIVAGRSSYFCPRCQPAPRRRRKAALRGPRKRARRTPRVIDGDGRATPRVRRTAAPQRRAR